MERGQFQIARLILIAFVLLASFQIIFAQTAGPLVMEDKPLRYSLQEGDTTVIIHMPKPSLLDQVTFLNESRAMRGALKIAVANVPLPATDPKWNPVNGEIAFAHKRLLNLSMVGVEAKYVKLSFHVEKEGEIATLGL